MGDRRRAPRIHLHTELHAKVKTYLDARVLEFSQTGALLEVDHPLPPRGICDLRFPLGGEVLQLHATVRRCTVRGHLCKGDGNRALTYHAALEFRDSDHDLAAVFAKHLASEDAGDGSLELSDWR